MNQDRDYLQKVEGFAGTIRVDLAVVESREYLYDVVEMLLV